MPSDGPQTDGPQSDRHSEVPVVGIGYSAGGLEAIRALMSSLAVDTGMAFVVIPHLKEDQKSHLTQILSQCTRMPVSTIENGVRVEANHVYIVPPGSNVVMAGDYLNLNSKGESAVHHLAIDFFFSSLSQSRKSKSIGVVLSGTGSDGTLGLKTIKSEGGITVVQDPKSAKFDGMPRSAIASGIVDLILAPEDIAVELERLARHPYTKTALQLIPHEHIPPTEESSELDQVLELLLTHTRIDFSKYKLSTIRRRIERQMMLRKIETLGKYAEYLRKNEEEVRSLYEDIFIHVTDFFRDPDAYGALRAKVFPALVKNREKSAPIRVWVPGCATGEEAYSLAIALTEFLEEQELDHPLNLFAGDISEPALQKARKGIYPDYQMRNISKLRLDRFFEKVKGGYKVRKSIRDLCIFSRHDVTSNPPIPRVDLISCRNVLIYFSAELQRRVFPVFHYALNPKGFLWLGRAENPDSASKLFTTIDKNHKIFARAAAGTMTTQPHFSTTLYSSTGIEAAAKSSSLLPAAADSFRSADQMILYRYSPPSVVVDCNFEILQFRGRTVPYLEPSPGAANYNLLKMANPEIAPSLRLCIQAARKQDGQARKEEVTFEFEGKKRQVSIEVSPLNPAAPPKERQYLVVFEDAMASRIARSKQTPALKIKRGKKGEDSQLENLAQYNIQLQQELEAAREYQQALIEEYEAAQEELTSMNEELRSTNEELQSTNEELHSTNEELGTAKEELQAANEELLSTNEEVQRRNSDLEKALRDLEESEQRFRLMISGVKDYAIFMLDADGRVATWNEGARRLKGYEAGEIIGQHFTKFYPASDKDWKPKMELEVATREGRFEDEDWRIRKDGSRFWANVVITAIRDPSQRLLGFAKVTRDLTERKRAEDEVRASREKFEKLARTFDTALSSSPDFHYTFDTTHRFTYANRTLLKLWGKTLDEVVGRTFDELGYPNQLARLQEEQLNEVLKGKTVRGDYAYTNPDGKEGYYEYIFVPILDEQGKVQAISGTTRDVTELKIFERDRLTQQQRELEHRQLKESEEQFRTLADSLPQLAWMANPDGHISWYNRRWYEYTGAAPEQMEGWGWQKVQDPDLLPEVTERWKKSLSEGTSFEMEFPLRGADGRYRWFLTLGEPVRDSKGRILRWFGTNTDIDEQRRARIASEILASASAVFSQSLDYEKTLHSLADVIVSRFADWCSIAVFDPNGLPRVAAVSHPDKAKLNEVQELFKDYPPDWNASYGAANVIRTGRTELFKDISDGLLRSAATNDRHLKLMLGLELRSALVVPLLAREKILGAITLIRSGTQRRYTDADVGLAEELGRRAGVAVDNAILYKQVQDAVQARDEFLSIASHELKTPLTSLQIQTQLRERLVAKGNTEAFVPDKLRKMFEGDKKQIHRLTRLIDDMLDVTRIAARKLALRPEPTDLQAVVKEVFDRLSSQFAAAGSSVEIEACDSVVGMFDRYRIEQVIVNLLTNALRYGNGKPVRVSLTKSQGEPHDRALLVVRDEGIGIAEEDQERIFQQFERATKSSVATGLGLGLYIAKQIVEGHGGTITVQSRPNEGASFIVELPL